MNNDDVETIENCPKSLAAWKREVEKLRDQLEAERQRADYGQQVLDQRNAECDRLINEISALKGDGRKNTLLYVAMKQRVEKAEAELAALREKYENS